jgi:hypothetical protein
MVFRTCWEKNVPYAARQMCSAPHLFQENSVLAGSIGCIIIFFYLNLYLKQVPSKKLQSGKEF